MIVYLKSLTKLLKIDLKDNKLTDIFIDKLIVDLVNIEFLDIRNNDLTEKCLFKLNKLKNLKELLISSNKIDSKLRRLNKYKDGFKVSDKYIGDGVIESDDEIEQIIRRFSKLAKFIF